MSIVQFERNLSFRLTICSKNLDFLSFSFWTPILSRILYARNRLLQIPFLRVYFPHPGILDPRKECILASGLLIAESLIDINFEHFTIRPGLRANSSTWLASSYRRHHLSVFNVVIKVFTSYCKEMIYSRICRTHFLVNVMDVFKYLPKECSVQMWKNSAINE